MKKKITFLHVFLKMCQKTSFFSCEVNKKKLQKIYTFLLLFLHNSIICCIFARDFKIKRFFAMNVTQIIHKYGYTTKEVSRQLGKHEKTLDVMLAKSRETNSMTVATLRAIADVIGCHISEFFADEPVTKNGVIVPSPDEKKGNLVLDVEGAIARSGIQKRELAKRIGITDVALSMMLRTGNPSYQRLREIADALGVSFFDLFAYEEK